MKTDIKIALVLIFNAALAILSLTCCGDGNPDQMIWRVSSADKNNVEVTFDPERRPQIEIVASAEGGECQIHCPNYEHVSFRQRNICPTVHRDIECQFHAEITAPGVITIKFDKLPENNHDFCTYFMIDGEDGEDFNATVVKVTRKFNHA